MIGVVLLMWSGTIISHVPGIGRAVVTFPSSHEYVVELTVDAASLLARLESLAGQPRSGAQSGTECAARIAVLRRELAKHVLFRVDGTNRPMFVESVETAADGSTSAESALAPEVRLLLRGEIPEHATFATWQYDLTFARYAFVVKSAQGTEDSTEWLEGGEESRAINVIRLSGPASWMQRASLYATRAARNVRANAFGYLVMLFAAGSFSRRLRSIAWQPTGPTEVPPTSHAL